MKIALRLLFVAVFAVAAALPAAAQSSQDDGWKVAIYPVMAWVPLGIAININIPPIDGGGGGTGPDFGGDIVDGRFDGAFFGGFSAEKGRFRIDADGLWAAVGGDRLDSPTLRVDVDAIYGHGSVGFAVTPGLFVTGGVRRLALKYDIDLAGRQFERKPGVWDPLVGMAWHKNGGKIDTHAVFEVGGFGVGSDVEINTGLRFDWKPVTHFGLTFGYNFMYFKVSDEALGRAFTVKQTLHGPVLGIGFYF